MVSLENVGLSPVTVTSVRAGYSHLPKLCLIHRLSRRQMIVSLCEFEWDTTISAEHRAITERSADCRTGKFWRNVHIICIKLTEL